MDLDYICAIKEFSDINDKQFSIRKMYDEKQITFEEAVNMLNELCSSANEKYKNIKPIFTHNFKNSIYLGILFYLDKENLWIRIADLYAIENERRSPSLYVRYGNEASHYESWSLDFVLENNFPEFERHIFHSAIECAERYKQLKNI